MFLKVENEDGNPKFYQLNKSKLVIGSLAGQCHIVLNDNAISKKHLNLVEENGEWFAVDMGSTNGSYFGDDQLVPGKRQKIEKDDLLRLGDKTYLTILDKVDPNIKFSSVHVINEVIDPKPEVKYEAQDKTRVISVQDIEAAKILTDKKKKRELQQKKKKELRKKREDANKMGKIFLIAVGLIMAGVVVNRVWMEKNKRINKDTIINKLKTKTKSGEEIEGDIEGYRITRAALLKRDQVLLKVNSEKCKAEEEKSLCVNSLLPIYLENGVVFQDPETYLIYFEEKSLLAHMRSTLDLAPLLTNEELLRLTVLMFINESLTDMTSVTDSTSYYFAFYKKEENKATSITNVIAINAMATNSLGQELGEMPLDVIELVKEMIDKTSKYYTYY